MSTTPQADAPSGDTAIRLALRSATRARRESIIQLVTDGDTAVESLSASLGVSSSTIRRDLADLRREGRITRTYGGALPSTRPEESTVSERHTQFRREKESIAERALAFVREGDHVFLDGGTTVGYLARRLSVFKNLTVITNSLSELPTLIDAEFTVILLGGEIRRTSQSTVGPLTEEALRRLSVDHAFLGADGIVAGRGICEVDLSQTVIKETMARNARKTAVLADASKLGQMPFGAWAVMPTSYTLVTDETAGGDLLEPFLAEPGTDVVVARAL